MALIPDPSQIRRDAPRPSTAVASYRGGLAETARAQFGAATAQFGADVAKMAEVEGERIDSSVVEKAYTELRQKRAELSIGEQGYATVKGDRVVHTPEGEKPFVEDYKGRFDAAVEGIASRLSPRQREKFGALAAREGVSFQTDAMTHALREAEAFHADAKEGAINIELQLGAANWNNAEKAGESLDRINAVYDNMILVDGLAADKVDALRATTLSKFHQNIIDQANAAGDTAGAKVYFETNKKQILNAEVVGQGITKAEDAKVDMEVGTAVAEENLSDPTTTGDLEAINREIKNDPRLKGDPDRIHAAQREAAAMVSARRDALNQKDAAVYRMVLEDKPLEQIKQTGEYKALSVAAQNKIIEKVEGKDEPTGARLSTFYKLVNEPKKLAGMTEDEIVIFGRDKNLGNSMTTKLLELNSQYKTKPEKIIEAKVDTEAFNVAYRAKVGKDPHEKGQKEGVEKARFYVENRVDAAQRQLGRQLTREEKQAFIDEALQQVETPTSFLGFSTGTKPVPLFATPAEKIAVPAEQRAIIVERLKRALPRGVEPTELDIQNLYLKAQQIPLG